MASSVTSLPQITTSPLRHTGTNEALPKYQRTNCTDNTMPSARLTCTTKDPISSYNSKTDMSPVLVTNKCSQCTASPQPKTPCSLSPKASSKPRTYLTALEPITCSPSNQCKSSHPAPSALQATVPQAKTPLPMKQSLFTAVTHTSLPGSCAQGCPSHTMKCYLWNSMAGHRCRPSTMYCYPYPKTTPKVTKQSHQWLMTPVTMQ